MSIRPDRAKDLIKETIEGQYILDAIRTLHHKYDIIPTSDEMEEIWQDARRSKEYYHPNIADSIAMSRSLSEDACDALIEGIEQIKRKIVDIYRDAGLSTGDKQREADISTRDFCWHLHQMQKHNGGILPDEFVKDWDLNSCAGYKF